MSSAPSDPVRERFRAKARAFDRLYDDRAWLQRRLRPALHLRTELALGLIERFDEPRVLDVGCGSARLGERALERGVREYVGVDFSDAMIPLARERLERFGSRARLVEGDFLTVPLDAAFDVVLALGFFDYVADPRPYARRMRELCAASAAASFPKWSWHKGPVRKVRYELIGDVPIFDYTRESVEVLFRRAGFDTVEATPMTRSGLYAEAGVSTHSARDPTPSSSA
jgi:SAM-dependent methyltransferase